EGVVIEGIPPGTVLDGAGNTAVLNHSNTLSDPPVRVDAIKPTVLSLELTSEDTGQGTLVKDDVVTVTVKFSEAVLVTGSPTIKLEIGTFTYTISNNQVDVDGIRIIENSLDNDSGESSGTLGTILDAAGNSALLGHDSVSVDTRPVDSVAPTVESINNLTIKKGEGEADELVVAVQFSERVFLAADESAKLTLLVNNENGDTQEVIVSATTSGQPYIDLMGGAQYLDFKVNFDDLPVGLYDTGSVQVKANSLSYEPNSLHDSAGNPVTKIFTEFSVNLEGTSLYQSIDTRTNKESKQTEGYGTFRDLVDGLAPDSPENLIRSADDGVINTDTLNLEINGGEGFDQIFGGVDDEHLFGGGGSDFLKGGGGNDTLDGGDGDDFVFADAGNDIVN
ncbi:MAG: hypothetical protein ACKVJK_18620, partial [Methylophagaceae bacterium]